MNSNSMRTPTIACVPRTDNIIVSYALSRSSPSFVQGPRHTVVAACNRRNFKFNLIVTMNDGEHHRCIKEMQDRLHKECDSEKSQKVSNFWCVHAALRIIVVVKTKSYSESGSRLLRASHGAA